MTHGAIHLSEHIWGLYARYFGVSELIEEQIQPKALRNEHTSAGGARAWTVYLDYLENQKALGTSTYSNKFSPQS